MEIKKDILEDTELRSEGVQDILTRPPHWMIRWGNSIIMLILVCILCLSYFIKYPELVQAPIIVTSKNPPEKIEARISSKIEKIFIRNNQKVKRGDIMMVLQSTANYEDVLTLRRIIDSTSQKNISSFPIQKINLFKLGELQSEYNTFAKAFQDEQLFSRLQPYAPENLAADQSISEYKFQIATLKQQEKLEFAKHILSRKNYERSQHLFNDGVISAMELENEKMKFLQSQQNLQNITLSLSQLVDGIFNLKRTKSGSNINSEKDKITYSAQSLQMFEELRKAIIQWEHNFIIISSTDGTASFQQYFGENQFVKSGDAILSVLPNNKEAVVGRMQVPSINSGKIAPGQKVLIKLDNYRYQEFGIIQGEVYNSSLIPSFDDKGNYYYYVDVILPKGLKTSYNKTLPFEKELRGDGEIVTEDLRLIERIFYQIRKLLEYQ